ncbi:MAG: hypothetical protein VB102_00300 [Paludibacter sp.]|nr:hypothetical protein [Paludibacter sp.]
MSDNTLKLPFKHYRFTFTTAHGYIYKILKYNIDYAINIDEDAFVVDNKALIDLLNYCITEKIVNCGMRDGGVLPIRYGNPVVTNPFFNILDVKEIRKNFSQEKINKYRDKEIDYDTLFSNIKFSYKYKISSDYEPYYPFFLWLNTNYKVYYLNVAEHKDKLSTILYNQEGAEILYHSWYSREYEKDIFHTQRIKDLYHLCSSTDISLSTFEKFKIWIELQLNKKIIPLLLPVRRIVLKQIKIK